MSDEIFYDLSEFIARPMRTGIQQASYEALKHWTFSPRLVPGFIDSRTGKVFTLPQDFLTHMGRWFDRSPANRAPAAINPWPAIRRRSRAISRNLLKRFSSVLNPELFFDEGRLEFYSRLAAEAPERIHWIVYDALPWLRPEFFAAGASAETAGYLRVLRRIPNLHFISGATRREFCQRILRADLPTYRVCPLGADALGVAEPSFSAAKKRFTYVSSIEPRKNHLAVFAAFEEVWKEHPDVELTLVGAPVILTEEIAAGLDRMKQFGSRFTCQRDLDGGAVKALVRSSRATIYASDAEGFGLPALESLALGVPVIAWRDLPSLSLVPAGGQVRLPDVSAGQIATGVRRMLVDAFARQKYDEISTLVLPTWQGMAATLHRAITDTAAAPARAARVAR